MPTQNPNPPEDSSSNWLPPYFWEDDVSLAYFAYDSRQANGEDNGSSLSNESSECSCDLTIEIEPAAICDCADEPDCDEVLEITAESKCDEDEVQIFGPHGTEAKGIGSAFLRYIPTSDDIGNRVEFTAYESACDYTGSISAPIFKTIITPIDWFARVKMPPQMQLDFQWGDYSDKIFKPNPNGFLYFSMPVPTGFHEGGDLNPNTYDAILRAKISVLPDPATDDERKIADDCCKKWRLVVRQNILTAGRIIWDYPKETVIKTWLGDKVDAFSDGGAIPFPFFTHNGDIKEDAYIDTPHVTSPVFGPNGDDDNDMILSCTMEDTIYYDWFVAEKLVPDGAGGEQRKSSIRWLKWVKWVVGAQVTFRRDHTGHIYYHFTRKRIEILGQGDGMGPFAPTKGNFPYESPDYFNIVTHKK